MIGYFSYDEVEGFRIFKTREAALLSAGQLKNEEETLNDDLPAGHRVFICWGTIEDIVLTNDNDLILLDKGGPKDGD